MIGYRFCNKVSVLHIESGNLYYKTFYRRNLYCHVVS